LLAFIAAEAREFSGLLRNTEMVSKLNWPVSFARMARLRKQAVLMVANGPGPKLAVRAVNTVCENEKVSGLVSVGFCGALDPALAPCDIFIATEVLGVGIASLPSIPRGGYKSGKLISMDRVITTAAEKSELRKRGASAVEMEAGAIAERAEHWNIPFYAVRVVTDTATESFPLDFNRMRDAEGRFDRAKIIVAALRKPALFPALIQLNQRSKAAAQVLGDFIADTQF
jgi:adenosylhomocysteine nucleosidase